MAEQIKSTMDVLLARYETLKKQWFKRFPETRTDAAGHEFPPPYTRDDLVRQFNAIGAEIPVTPDQPFIAIGSSRQE